MALSIDLSGRVAVVTGGARGIGRGITEALLAAIPEHNKGARRLSALAGMVPGREDRPAGCLFAPRCKYRTGACDAARPALGPLAGHPAATQVRCIHPLNSTDAGAP